MNTISIRKIYLYLFALIGLVISTIGAIQLVDLGLRSFIFQDADAQYAYPIEKPVIPVSTSGAASTARQPSQEELDAFHEKQRRSQRQRESANALAMLIIGLPLYAYHWRVIKKEKNEQ